MGTGKHVLGIWVDNLDISDELRRTCKHVQPYTELLYLVFFRVHGSLCGLGVRSL